MYLLMSKSGRYATGMIWRGSPPIIVGFHRTRSCLEICAATERSLYVAYLHPKNISHLGKGLLRLERVTTWHFVCSV